MGTCVQLIKIRLLLFLKISGKVLLPILCRILFRQLIHMRRLAIPTLADTTGILVSTPEFFYVPDDPSLGYYKPLFANKICMLERKDPGEGDR